MAIQVQGASGAIAGVGAEASSPLHVSTKPTPYGTLGHYALATRTGAIAAGAGANSEIFHARWIDATRFGVIYELILEEFDNTTGFTAGRFEFNLMLARGWSADGSGGTALTLTGNNNKLRTSMGSSLYGAMRTATTAALTAGTKTFDTQPFKIIGGRVGAIANKHTIPQSNVVTTQECAAGPGLPLFSRDPGSEHPIILASNGGSTSEGPVVRATMPATGVWSATVSKKWCEVTAY